MDYKSSFLGFYLIFFVDFIFIFCSIMLCQCGIGNLCQCRTTLFMVFARTTLFCRSTSVKPKKNTFLVLTLLSVN